MSASFYDLLKYAATGIASPDMSYYDKMRASTLMGGGTVQTLTGIPPLSFPSDGSPITVWSMKGNGQQSGTPSSQSIIMPTFCGVRTGNLFDKNDTNLIFAGTSLATSNEWYGAGGIGKVIRIPCNPSTTYTISGESYSNILRISMVENEDIPDFEGSVVCIDVLKATSVSTQTFTTTANTKYILVQVSAAAFDDYINVLMLNLGNTALPYEPYGWKIPISCAGQTVPVYLGQVSTVRRVKKLVFDGTENVSYNARNDTRGRYAVTIPVLSGTTTPTNVICTHFITVNATTKPLSEGGICMRSTGADVIIGGLYTDIGITSPSDSTTIVSAFKSWLASQYAAGTPVTVWYVLAEPTTGIVNEPLCKIGDYADELNSTDAAVTIPTEKGQNTLTVETDLQPSEMTITYKG